MGDGEDQGEWRGGGVEGGWLARLDVGSWRSIQAGQLRTWWEMAIDSAARGDDAPSLDPFMDRPCLVRGRGGEGWREGREGRGGRGGEGWDGGEGRGGVPVSEWAAPWEVHLPRPGRPTAHLRESRCMGGRG